MTTGRPGKLGRDMLIKKVFENSVDGLAVLCLYDGVQVLNML